MHSATEQLITHYREHHNEKISIYSKTFKAFSEFEEWKEHHEIETMASFVLNFSPKQRSDHMVYSIITTAIIQDNTQLRKQVTKSPRNI